MAPPPVPPEEGGAAEAREGEGYASEGEEGLLGAAALDEGPPVDFDDLIDEEDLIGPGEPLLSFFISHSLSLSYWLSLPLSLWSLVCSASVPLS